MGCSNCNKKQNCNKNKGNKNMQTTQINQNPYVERVRSIAIRSNKKCQGCGYKLNISDTLQQHQTVGEAFDNLINMLNVEFQLNENEKEYLKQQSVNFIRYNDVVWTINKIMDNRPPNMRNVQRHVSQHPQQKQVTNQTVVQQQQNTQRIVQQDQIIRQQPQNVVPQNQVVPKPVTVNPVSTKTLQEKTNDLFLRIKKQNEEMLKQNVNKTPVN